MSIVINMNTGTGLFRTQFPDGQPHVNIGANYFHEVFDIVCSIISPKELLELKMVVNAIERSGNILGSIHIPYLMGARFDRVMQKGDSFDLEVIAEIINSLKANSVYLFDPHSDVAPALIKNSFVVDNRSLVLSYTEQNAVLIIPDAGAAKKAGKYLEWNKNIVDSVQCVKQRDLNNGKITLKVLEPEKCDNRNCVIIDDLCDGGGTFNAIRSQINPYHSTLIVTHGIFSKGFKELSRNFERIITSDSYPPLSFCTEDEISELEDIELLKIIPCLLK